jgi:putative addiction module killer protein
MENDIKQIIFYETEKGKQPFTQWLNSIKDRNTQSRILTRIYRLKIGNYGNFKRLDNELIELKYQFGPGYRVYCSEIGNMIVLLLCGGDKSNQSKDIEKAKGYLNDYKERIK